MGETASSRRTRTRRVFRNRVLNTAVAASFMGVALVFAWTAPQVPVVGMIISTLVALYFAVSAVKAFRAGVYLDDGGVTVRGYGRTARVAWRDVAGVATAPGSPLNSQTVLIGVQTNDGRALCTQGFSARVRSYKKGDRIADLADALAAPREEAQR